MYPTLLPAIQKRYACRQFMAEKRLSAEELALLLEAGQLAPSAFGLEPWRFIVVQSETEHAAIAQACLNQPAATTASALIVIVALVAALDPDSEYVRSRFEAEARGEDPAQIEAAYRSFYRADSIAGWAQGQCNFAASHIMLQAAHMGCSSCPIGGYDANALATALNLPPGETPALVIALGHCSYPAPPRLRKPLR
jgi:nitroreductase